MWDRLENDKVCLDLWQHEGSPQALSKFINRYKGRLFSFVIYLTGCDLNAAYEITADSFAESLAGLNTGAKGELSVLLFKRAIYKCRHTKAVLFFDPMKYINAGESRKNILRAANAALTSLTFDQREVLLLRDQANLSYAEIASILEVSLQDIKVKTGKVKNQYREKIEKQLE
jgi:DNA-directed RNA polymerase specialized sigma24 family protein